MIQRNRITEFEKILISLKELDFKSKIFEKYLKKYD